MTTTSSSQLRLARLQQLLAAHTALMARLDPADLVTITAKLDQEAARIRDWIRRDQVLDLDAVAQFLDGLRVLVHRADCTLVGDPEMAEQVGLKIAAACQLARILQ